MIKYEIGMVFTTYSNYRKIVMIDRSSNRVYYLESKTLDKYDWRINPLRFRCQISQMSKLSFVKSEQVLSFEIEAIGLAISLTKKQEKEIESINRCCLRDGHSFLPSNKKDINT